MPAETGCSPCSEFAVASLASLVNPLNVPVGQYQAQQVPQAGLCRPSCAGGALCPELGEELPVWWVPGLWLVTGPQESFCHSPPPPPLLWQGRAQRTGGTVVSTRQKAWDKRPVGAAVNRLMRFPYEGQQWDSPLQPLCSWLR